MINASTLDDSRSSHGAHTPSLDAVLDENNFSENASLVLDNGMSKS
jgi:hypothetical protein